VFSGASRFLALFDERLYIAIFLRLAVLAADGLTGSEFLTVFFDPTSACTLCQSAGAPDICPPRHFVVGSRIRREISIPSFFRVVRA